MTQVYMIANLKIEDAETYRKYEKGFFPSSKNTAAVLSPMTTRSPILKAARQSKVALSYGLFRQKKLHAAGLMMPTIRLCQNFAAPVHRSPR